MANFIVSYDLIGPLPSHKQMDQHLKKLGTVRKRILATVWYVGYSGNVRQLHNHVRSILGEEDRLIIVEANDAAWTNLLINGRRLLTSWRSNRFRHE
jgi:hypothetical protein